jgi:hypothetical protein
VYNKENETKEVNKMIFFYKGYYDTEYKEVTADFLNNLNYNECSYGNTCVALTEIKGNKMYFDYFEGNE